ncbi:MAG: phosphoribosyltransferase family protein [Chitinophagaceae bacterium]
MQNLKHFIQDFSHLFFPHICIGCGTDIIGQAALLCFHCINRLPVTNFNYETGNQVEKLFYGRLPVIHAGSYCYFSKDSLVQRILHQLKYRGNKELGFFIGRMMGDWLMQSRRFDDIDALVPLPLYASREKRRGYNQAAILCDGIASSIKIPVLSNAVTRVSATETQTHKNRIERWHNMEGRFRLQNSEALKNKHVLLVDDVITTGATLEACGQELIMAANTQVSILTFAYTV